MPRRNRNTKGVQLKPHAGYPNASLEGLPSEVKLEIVKLIGDLPSLRRLRLASQEYYAVVRAYAGYLKPFYPGELTLRLYRNIGRTVTTFEHRRAAWSEEFDRALIHGTAIPMTIPDNVANFITSSSRLGRQGITLCRKSPQPRLRLHDARRKEFPI